MLGVAATAVLVGAPSVSDAQSRDGIRVGALGGASITSVTGFDAAATPDDEIDLSLKTSNRYGFQLGAYLTVPLSSTLSFQPELHYIQKGAKVMATSNDLDGAVSLRLNTSYVELPLLLRFESGRQAQAHPFIVLGPSVAYRVSCRTAFSLMGLQVEDSCKSNSEDFGEETDDPIKTTDFGVVGGLGISGLVGGFPLSAQVRYAHGITSITGDESEQESRYKGVSILLGVGFRAR